jgi:hypothetical protein
MVRSSLFLVDEISADVPASSPQEAASRTTLMKFTDLAFS